MGVGNGNGGSASKGTWCSCVEEKKTGHIRFEKHGDRGGILIQVFLVYGGVKITGLGPNGANFTVLIMRGEQEYFCERLDVGQQVTCTLQV